MTPLQRRTLTLAIAGLGILAYRNPTLRRWLTPQSNRALGHQTEAATRILPISAREKYVR